MAKEQKKSADKQTIYQLLKEDHREVKEMLETLEEGRDEKLFEKMRTDLLAHAFAEEETFYSLITEAGDEEREDIMEAKQEHHVVELLLEELKSAPLSDEEWTAKLKVLKENVLHHVKEEEGNIFDEAKEILSKEESYMIADEMMAMKEALKSEWEKTSASQKSKTVKAS